MKWLIPVSILSCLIACMSPSTTGLTLMPEMADTDSTEILFFKSPDSPRFFTYLPVTERKFIDALVGDISTGVQPEMPENTCMKEGKIYCHKNGQIFNTIFFSYSADDCRFLRFIKNGKLYYFTLSDDLQTQLMRYKLQAKEIEAAF